MIDKMLDQLFLSGALDVYGESAQAKLEQFRITHVLTLAVTPIPEERQATGVSYKFLQMADNQSQDILGTEIIPEAIHLIETAIKDGGNLLVHSEEGKSRAPTIVAAYLMKLFKWKADKALTFIKVKRPNVRPNAGFVEQLNIYTMMHWHCDSREITHSAEYRKWKVKSTNRGPRAVSLSGPRPDHDWAPPRTPIRKDLPSVIVTDNIH